MKNFLFTRRSLGVGGFLLALVLLGLIPETSLAQKLNVWKGGQAGRATDWNCPRNWSLGFVPDWTCAVAIGPDASGTGNCPVIKEQVEPFQYLLLPASAWLVVAEGVRLEFELPEACLLAGEIRYWSKTQQKEGPAFASRR